MTLSTTEGSIWKMMTQVYDQWDPEWTRLMPEEELQKRLPAVPGDVLDHTLEHAVQEQVAERGESDGGRAFRPVRPHDH